ncbi:AAA family ATPase [Methylobacterium sp. NMS14P]|uniref:AAA family ATPase n=1 Tax=Methylobacterium sp. NMS14P TaxID=2894310 RepID=UPI00235914E3|nr:AAA family ATPase [Methylobacterium sp. NMS14P]WCS27974.1 AAA family ATPase [Methylobacterium sp. NMS14P]
MYHLASLGDRLAADRLRGVVARHARRDGAVEGRAALIATLLGCEMLDGFYTPQCIPGTQRYDVVGQWREAGEEYVAQVALATRERVRDAIVEARASEREAEEPAPKHASLAGFRKAAAEPTPPAGSAVIFPPSVLEGAGRSDNVKELQRILKCVLDVPLPGVRVPADWDTWEHALLARHPNGGQFFLVIRRSQGGREFWGHAVVCADGPAGAGKSAMCRSVAEVSGLRIERYQCDNASDNSYGGTPIRWVSAQQDFITAAFVELKQRTFIAMLDEVEKAGGSRDSNSGKLHDVLLGQMDTETAAAWPSNFLCHPVDLTGVLFLCTANDASSLPTPLRDRMVVARVDEPTADHLAALAPQVAREVCRRQGLDERWGTLDAIEMASLAEAWPGGSIRRLVRLVEVVLQARDEGPAAAPPATNQESDMQHIETPAARREALASLTLHVLKLACAGQVNAIDAAAVSDAIRLIRAALPEPEEASDAA